jgi:hypothetical protein
MTKTCFVIQGFGKKTDFESGRTLDLDASYEVIHEAVTDAGLACVRADEIPQSGHIERVMYEQLFRADLVIADLSTSNVNAFYELGVRFALRPRATIVVAEDKITFPFDINHIPIRTYEHLGSDIGRREAKRFKADLVNLISEIMSQENADSPVFTFLPNLVPHEIPTEQAEEALPSDKGQTIGNLKRQAREAMNRSDFESAMALWKQVREEGPKDDFVVQQLALATYKSKNPTEVDALKQAKEFLKYLWPQESLDPETLGLWAAVHKRLYELEGDSEALDEAITATERGFVLRRDYYNGINLAFLLDTRAVKASSSSAREDHAQAKSVRRRVAGICQKELEAGEDMNKESRYWVLATLQETAVGLGNDGAAEDWGDQAQALGVASWMIDSTTEQLAKLRKLLAEIEAKEGS